MTKQEKRAKTCSCSWVGGQHRGFQSRLWAEESWVQFMLPPKFFGEPATLKFVCCQCITNDINYLCCTAGLKRHSIGTEKVVGQRKKIWGEKEMLKMKVIECGSS